MPRLLFQKTGNAVWISHLDLMRVFQRAFKRAGLALTHTQGFNPRPSVSIALPLSVGVESACELLDFDLDGDAIPCEEICSRLNSALIEGVEILAVYDNGRKLRELSLLSCEVTMEYDDGVTNDAVADIQALFQRGTLLVPKKTKSGTQDHDIIPMIHKMQVIRRDEKVLVLRTLISCQNPTLNPSRLVAAIDLHLPHWKPDYSKCRRVELYDAQEMIFR